MGAPRDQQHAICQDQTHALVQHLRIETEHASVWPCDRIRGGARHRRLYGDGAARSLESRRDIERVQLLYVARALFGTCDQIDGSRDGVHDRSTNNAHVADDIQIIDAGDVRDGDGCHQRRVGKILRP